jgi:hypothetical protein
MARPDIELVVTDLAQHGLPSGNIDESKPNCRGDTASLTYSADNLLRFSTTNSRACTPTSSTASTSCSTYALAVTLSLGSRV